MRAAARAENEYPQQEENDEDDEFGDFEGDFQGGGSFM
jgi:hypothetical protein